MRGNAERSDRRRTENVARKTKFLARRIVMLAEKIGCLDNIDIVDLCRLQDLACAFRSDNVGSGPHLAPAAQRTPHANLSTNPHDQWDADVKHSMRSNPE